MIRNIVTSRTSKDEIIPLVTPIRGNNAVDTQSRLKLLWFDVIDRLYGLRMVAHGEIALGTRRGTKGHLAEENREENITYIEVRESRRSL